MVTGFDPLAWYMKSGFHPNAPQRAASTFGAFGTLLRGAIPPLTPPWRRARGIRLRRIQFSRFATDHPVLISRDFR